VPLSPPFATFLNLCEISCYQNAGTNMVGHTSSYPLSGCQTFSHPPPFFSGLSYSLSASCPITTFLLRKCFPRPYKHTPEPEASHARVRSLSMPEGKAHPRQLSKDKGSILRVWREAWFPTVPLCEPCSINKKKT